MQEGKAGSAPEPNLQPTIPTTEAGSWSQFDERVNADAPPLIGEEPVAGEQMPVVPFTDAKAFMAAHGLDSSVLISPDELKKQQQEEREEQERLRKIERYDELNSMIDDHIERTRGPGQAAITEDFKAGRLKTEADVAARLKRVEDRVAEGPSESWGYNSNQGSKYYRSQDVNFSRDDQGNIWGKFEEVDREDGITGQPRKAGKRMILPNPYAPKPE